PALWRVISTIGAKAPYRLLARLKGFIHDAQ
ncbi:MAG: hypothetical protein EORIYHIE_002573, partial [Candidatus Fervidibacter sp.]